MTLSEFDNVIELVISFLEQDWATDFTGDLGKPDFLFYRPV